MIIDAKLLYFILDNTPAEQNIMLVGKHGIGKSRILEDYYSAKGRYITQTLLFKVLALLDFRALKQNGRPCIEFTYTARNLGPVPEELYNGDVKIVTDDEE